MPIQTRFTNITALVVDDMSVQQTTLRGQLAQLGISKIDVCSNAEDAARLIKHRRYGLVLCDYNLNQKTDGQQLFEHLRDQNALAADCLFFMVTAESSYASVAAATEHHPDAYLLKPITASDIEDRLKTLLDKREALLPITQRLVKDDLPGAVLACDQVLAATNRWYMAALQIKGQTLLRLGRHQEAKATYKLALEKRPQLIWAQLGLARAHKAASQFDEARQIAQEIIESPEGKKNVAAYDVVAEALEAQGDPQAAMQMLRDAATVVPSARRHRLAGESAYRNGDLDAAKDYLQKVAKATRGSVVAQPQDILLLAQTLVDRGEPADALRVLADSAATYKKNPEFENVAQALQAQAHQRAGASEAAEAAIKRARETLCKAKADFATLALAKAELMCGHEAEGLGLMQTAVSSDHENPRIKQLIGNALRETGHGDKSNDIILTPAAALESKVQDARKLLGNSRIDDAVSAIEQAVKDYPENTGVLLQAAQINCVALRLKKEINPEMVERVRQYLSTLETLLPANDRVTMMRRYFRETLASLEAAPAIH